MGHDTECGGGLRVNPEKVVTEVDLVDAILGSEGPLEQEEISILAEEYTTLVQAYYLYTKSDAHAELAEGMKVQIEEIIDRVLRGISFEEQMALADGFFSEYNQ